MAKLVDILARELKEWPEGVSAIEQDRKGICLYEVSGAPIKAYVSEIAEDSWDGKVTRAEWQAAVDALNKPDEPAWNGEGLPPIGAEVEAMMPGCHGGEYAWVKAKVVHGPLPESPSEILVFNLENTRPRWVDEFRPIRTPEQIAADDIAEIAAHIGIAGDSIRHLSDAIVKAGYRKQVQP